MIGCKVERLRRLRLELFADEERRLERAERHAAWAIVALRAVAAWRRFARRRVALRKPFLRRAFARLVAVGCWFAVRRWHARAQQALARRGSLVIADTLGPRIAERVAFRKLRSFSELGRRRRADGLANARRRARAIARWRHAVVRGSALRRADARVARRAVAAWRSFVATRPERERKAARRAAEALRVVARRLVRRWDARARGRKAAFQLADLVYDRWLGRLLRRWRDKSNHPEDALRARLQFRRFRRATRQKAADRAIDLYADASRARRGVAKLRSAANRSRAERSLRAVSRAAFAALAARRCLSRLATHAFLCRGRRAADHHFASARLRVALSRLSSKRPRPRFVVVPRRVFATWRAFASRRRERRARIARGFIVRWRKRASRRADSIRRARAFRQEKIDRRAAFLLPVAFHALNTDARARWARRHATDLAARRRAYQLKRDVFRAWATLSRNRQTTTTTSLRIVVDDDLDYAPRQRKPPLPADRPRRMVEYG